MIRLPQAPFAVVRFHPDQLRANHWQLLFEPKEVILGNVGEISGILRNLEIHAHWFGFLGYEIGEWTEDVPRREPCDWGIPDFWFANFQKSESIRLEKAPLQQSRVDRVDFSVGPETYRQHLSRIQQYLEAGDVYQANLTVRFQASQVEDPWSIFLRIAERSQASYTAYLDTGSFKVLTFSPELFLERQGKRIWTNPIKGTIGRSKNPEADARAVDWLRSSGKNLAELLMIVDLERNDLGRICETGSIRWGPFPDLISLPNVFHLSCPVSGVLRSSTSLGDILRATFPGGSISGAPKRRALQILREIEPFRRGPYCGGIGYLAADRMLLNLGIRTGVWRNGTLRFWGGGGIVADHDPDQEQDEIRSKLEPFSTALGVPLEEFWRTGD